MVTKMCKGLTDILKRKAFVFFCLFVFSPLWNNRNTTRIVHSRGPFLKKEYEEFTSNFQKLPATGDFCQVTASLTWRKNKLYWGRQLAKDCSSSQARLSFPPQGMFSLKLSRQRAVGDDMSQGGQCCWQMSCPLRLHPVGWENAEVSKMLWRWRGDMSETDGRADPNSPSLKWLRGRRRGPRREKGPLEGWPGPLLSDVVLTTGRGRAGCFTSKASVWPTEKL